MSGTLTELEEEADNVLLQVEGAIEAHCEEEGLAAPQDGRGRGVADQLELRGVVLHRVVPSVRLRQLHADGRPCTHYSCNKT